MRKLLLFCCVAALLAACGDDKIDDGGLVADAGGDARADGDSDTADAGADTVSDTVSDASEDADAGADAEDFDAYALAPGEVSFGELGSLSQASGEGGFRFGAATAAAQIEDGLTRNDWYFWTLPEDQGGMGESEPVGDAVSGASKALEDIGLMEAMNLDAYRFSVDWSRIEPRRDEVDQAGVDHYDAFIDGLVDAGIRPMITVHHFSNPIWVHDFREDPCTDAQEPTDANLCGWAHPGGADQIIDELAEHAALLAREYGDRVDEWCTLNEPINYLLASYGVGFFPPGEDLLLSDAQRVPVVLRNYIKAHVAVYDAIKQNDTVDADGDGVAADVGFSLSIVDWQPARDNAPSTNTEDIAATERIWYVYHHLFPDSVINGTFDADFDGSPDEQHPDWAGKLDWLGAQYYFRAGVTAKVELIPLVDATICFDTFDFGSCLPSRDASHWVPSMGYEYYEPGIYNVLTDLSERYPDVPLVVTEAGIAAKNGTRRAENVVRTLEQMQRAIDDGVDLRGYYHWSLMDNFEWAEGYHPKFGLYSVDLDTMERTPTEGATVFGEVAGARKLTEAQRDDYGGLGPMSEAVEE
ncbi:glycoside hydrolase family 1 protein [Persicimonas caeni]|uniref:Glycoside hydrolase family 1 protein n=1 Tax=Persicimonas caeni TaxID=2292766 RepID=A0A4Y6PZP7_PERCE|nr:family 1 glycosylhydrolase [Persicimonas caeni]QDG53801.1 glycoside hydrolase family 1 protein [Persicimonas caeni]QED35022.1 glycoside hydrolase family 1 protein [Persicimonas caeni]